MRFDDGYTVITQVFFDHDTPRCHTPIPNIAPWSEPNTWVSGGDHDSDKENVDPNQQGGHRTSIDCEIFGESDAELSISDHPSIVTPTRDQSPDYVL